MVLLPAGNRANARSAAGEQLVSGHAGPIHTLQTVCHVRWVSLGPHMSERHVAAWSS
jgi:hypothetical protein